MIVVTGTSATGAGFAAPGATSSENSAALASSAVLVERSQDVLNVIAGLRIRGYVAVLLHRTRTRIVGGDRQALVAAEPIEQPAQIARAAGHVLRRIVRITHAEGRGRRGHQLHESLRADL